ncbi:MAG: PucR family transcriptional regulator, partial [Candidatus Saccharibacteria bacterium]
SPRPIIINSCRYTNLERIIGKVAINDKVVGYVIVLTNQMQFTEKDIELVALICDVVASEMGKNKLYSDTRGLMYENLLVDLLENKINRTDLVLERARSAGYHAGDRLYVMSIDIQQNQANHYFVDYIRESVEKRFLDCKSVLYKNNIVVLLDLKSPQISEESLIERMQTFLQKNNLRAGVSRRFSSLVQFREHYEQSQKTLKLATILDKEGYLFFFERLKVYHLLSLAAEREDLMSYCHPAVFQLINWDEAHGTSYEETLWALLSNDLNINLAAEKMFIHRNTMSYRVGKIIEMTGLNLKDGDTVFQLLLTKRVLTYINHVYANQPEGIPSIGRKKANLDR